MKTEEPFDYFKSLGKQSPEPVELKTLKALLAKARSLGFSEDEIRELRYRYRHGLNGIGK